MAANLKGAVLAGSIGKRFAIQIWNSFSRDPAPAFSASVYRRSAHFSSYDKEVDDQVRPTVVPDHVIQSGSDDKYWGPHPKTGVFGPAEQDAGSGGNSLPAADSSSSSSANGSSVLDQTVWFRPLEDVDKPPYA